MKITNEGLGYIGKGLAWGGFWIGLGISLLKITIW